MCVCLRARALCVCVCVCVCIYITLKVIIFHKTLSLNTNKNFFEGCYNYHGLIT
jgi:hypothetical protein